MVAQLTPKTRVQNWRFKDEMSEQISGYWHHRLFRVAALLSKPEAQRTQSEQRRLDTTISELRTAALAEIDRRQEECELLMNQVQISVAQTQTKERPLCGPKCRSAREQNSYLYFSLRSGFENISCQFSDGKPI
jgi:hypothetical protein